MQNCPHFALQSDGQTMEIFFERDCCRHQIFNERANNSKVHCKGGAIPYFYRDIDDETKYIIQFRKEEDVLEEFGPWTVCTFTWPIELSANGREMTIIEQIKQSDNLVLRRHDSEQIVGEYLLKNEFIKDDVDIREEQSTSESSTLPELTIHYLDIDDFEVDFTPEPSASVHDSDEDSTDSVLHGSVHTAI